MHEKKREKVLKLFSENGSLKSYFYYENNSQCGIFSSAISKFNTCASFFLSFYEFKILHITNLFSLLCSSFLCYEFFK